MAAPGDTQLGDVMASLREDHRNFAVLLEIVAEEATAARKGGDPDFELLADIMHYMSGYSDAIHHPAENRVYELLARSQADDALGLGRVEVEHRELTEMTRDFRNLCDAGKSGAALRRERLVDAADAYIKRLGEHIAWEEKELFPRADRLVLESAEIAVVAANDPVFGPRPEAAFNRLLERLREEADWR